MGRVRRLQGQGAVCPSTQTANGHDPDLVDEPWAMTDRLPQARAELIKAADLISASPS